MSHRRLKFLGIAAFFLFAALIGAEVYRGLPGVGYLWVLPVLAVLAYLVADLLSGFVHFLLDNFGSPDTPVIGPGFILPFRRHHIDPLQIVRYDLVDMTGNNSLASVPFMLLSWLAVPIATTAWGFLFGAFFLFLCLAVFATSQFHKWAHMETPPSWVARLQAWGVILSREHHNVHHQSPYDTYYCITVGLWNPLLDRTRFFERTERLLRRTIPETDPRLRAEREPQQQDVRVSP